MRSLLAYTLARAGLLVLALGLLYLLGARGVLLVLGALVLSGVVSLVLLSRQRDALSSSVSRGVERTKARIERETTKEDVDD